MAENASARPPRVYVPDLDAQGGTPEERREIPLSREERTHVRSRRLRDGDEVIALDGKGRRVRARLTRNGTAAALLPREESLSSLAPASPSPSSLPGEPANRVTVLLACAEPARVEWAVEKGTECGAAGFVLLACERSQKAHVAVLSSPARLMRLRRIAIEATKQCDRTLVPFVEGPESPGGFLVRSGGEGTLVVADPAGAPLAPGPVGDAVVAIGPEGGFSPSELSSFAGRSPVFLSLGPRVLRLETAVVAALVRLVDAG
jgi:16S rRNA (uracil1498-N3)-methyltransferase